MFFFVFSKFSIEEDVYRTYFHGLKPESFDESLYSRSFTKQVEKVEYNCYLSKNPNNEKTDLDPVEYLSMQLNGTCQTFTHTKYWYFYFCPFESLSQYRFQEGTNNKIDNFILGTHDNQKPIFTRDGVSFEWTNGDICYATKKPRTVRVDYICDYSTTNEGIVSSISEPSYCNYIVKYNTHYACAVPKVSNESVYDINCYSTTNSTQTTSQLNHKEEHSQNIQKGQPIKSETKQDFDDSESDIDDNEDSANEPMRSWMDVEKTLKKPDNQLK